MIRFSFMIRVCKIISPGDFFIFSKFCFFGLSGCKGAKMTNDMVPNDKKLCLSHSIYQDIFGTHV